MESEKKVSAPYLPFQTFLTALDHIKSIGGVPNQLDFGVFPSLNHQAKSQVLSAFKFLELIDDEGYPKGDTLSQLALQPDNRKTILHGLIKQHYPDIVALDLEKITPTQLDNALGNSRYNISGETKKKAKTFLIKAAQFADFKVSVLLTKITRNRRKGAGKQATTGGGKTSQAEANGNGDTPAEPIIQRTQPTRGSEKTVQLKSGAGSVTLSIDVDLLELEPGEERDFVLKLRDMFRAYEKGLTSSTEGTNKVEKEAGE